jgi:hypothetical protein
VSGKNAEKKQLFGVIGGHIYSADLVNGGQSGIICASSGIYRFNIISNDRSEKLHTTRIVNGDNWPDRLVASCSISGDGQSLFSSIGTHGEQGAYIYDLRRKKVGYRYIGKLEADVRNSRWLPGRKAVLICDQNGIAYLWRFSAADVLSGIVPRKHCFNVSVSPDGSKFAVVGSERVDIYQVSGE